MCLAIFSWGCRPDDRFEEVPYLEWRNAELRFVGDSADNRRVMDLTVYFTDGDGDIGKEGLEQDSICDLKNYDQFLDRFDLFIYYYEKVGGEFREIAPLDSCFPYHNILPDITPEGQNKTLEGDITTPFDFANFPINRTDSVRFEIVLEDRSGNRSNRIVSPSIGLDP